MTIDVSFGHALTLFLWVATHVGSQIYTTGKYSSKMSTLDSKVDELGGRISDVVSEVHANGQRISKIEGMLEKEGRG